MKLYKCEMCGKKVSMVHDHHILPWRFSHDDSESNIMRLCPSCHKKADTNFVNLVMYGEMNVGKSSSKRAKSRYAKKYRPCKILYTNKILKYTWYQDRIYYNIRTGCISIVHRWHYAKSNGNVSLNVKNRKRLMRAASAKGQTMLSGRC